MRNRQSDKRTYPPLPCDQARCAMLKHTDSMIHVARTISLRDKAPKKKALACEGFLGGQGRT